MRQSKKKRTTEKSEKSDFRIFPEIANIASAPVGTPRLIGGGVGVGVSARLQHMRRIRQWDPRAENWVPICASTWDPNPRLGPALPAIAIWKWEVCA
jgi:hypothetical protein